MTKKHFAAIAQVFRNEILGHTGTEYDCAALALVAQELADKFSSFNPSFSKSKFLVACGLSWDTKRSEWSVPV